MTILFILTSSFILDRNYALPMDLTQFQWKKRLLFLFAPDASHPIYEKLRNEIAKQADEVQDRDLVIFEIFEQGASRMNTEPIDRQTAASIRDQFAVPSQGFAIILIGKDGGVKLKREDYVILADIFNLIDSMPMRQNEMRQRKQ